MFLLAIFIVLSIEKVEITGAIFRLLEVLLWIGSILRRTMWNLTSSKQKFTLSSDLKTSTSMAH